MITHMGRSSMAYPADLVVQAYRPSAGEYAWTFGGVAPVARVRPGTVLELFSEDAFAGRVRGVDDLVSRVVQFPFVNPQTGPFYVEGAEPGDTLAVHFVSIEPARDCAASSPGSVSTQWTFRWTPCTGRSGSPRPTSRPAHRSCPTCTAETWIRRR